MTIKMKILIPVSIITVFIATAILLSIIVQFSRYINNTTEERADAAMAVTLNKMESLKPFVQAASLYMAEDAAIIRALAEGDRNALLSRAIQLQAETGIGFCTIADTAGNALIRAHQPESYGDNLLHLPSVRAAFTGVGFTTIEQGVSVNLSVVSATPVYDSQHQFLGVICAGFRLDTDAFVDSIKSLLHCEVAVYLGDNRISTTVFTDAGERATGTQASGLFAGTLMQGQPFSGKGKIFDRDAFIRGAPIIGPHNEVLGMLLVGYYMNDAKETISAFVGISVVIVIILLALFLVGFQFILNRIVTPINAMITAAHALVDVNTKAVSAGSKDEIQNLTNAFNYMVDNTRILANDSQRLGVVVSSADAGIIVKDKNGQVLEWNSGAESILGYAPEEMKGKISYYYAPESEHGGIDEIERRLRSGERILRIDVVRLHKNGTHIDCSASYSPYFDEQGNYEGSVAIFHDISDKKRMEKALQDALQAAEEASKVKSTFLATMSHEIRTPMNAVISITALLLEEKLTARQYAYLKDIKTSGENLLSLINDILDFSKIESGKFEIIPVHFDFPGMLSDIYSSFTFITREKHLQFIIQAEEPLPPCLFGDDIRIRQVLTNLLSNAAKFTAEGHIALTTRVDADSLYFDIADTGIGISQKDMDKLFDSFQQLDTAANRKKTGTGLGLSITKSLIELMGGQISVESEYGIGSVFHVRLPRVDGDLVKLSKGKEDEPIYLHTFDVHVLVVDDYATNLRVASGLLGLCGIQCDTAEDGQTALAMIARKPYDMVFMDHMMPDMDGVETTQRIRAMGFRRLPVIALTANAVQGVKETLIESGMDDFLSKPIDKQQLNEMLLKWLPPEKVQVYKQKPSEKPPTPCARKREQAGCMAQSEPKALDTLAALRDIEALDLSYGLALVSGMTDVYREALCSLAIRIPSAIHTMVAYLADNNIKRFATDIHGIKSALGTVGARRLSAEAALMEAQALRGGIVFCQKKFPVFTEKLMQLWEKLYTVFGDEIQEAQCTTMLPLTDLLEKIQHALEKFDDITALAFYNILVRLYPNADTDEALQALKIQIELFEYDNALNGVKKLLASKKEAVL